MEVFEQLESNVRFYSRSFPVVFERASGSTIAGEDGKEYIDFFSAAGSLNYGHNNPAVTSALIAYLENDGIVQALDQATVAKRDFLETFGELILEPRGLPYRVQFPGPTGTNAVEAALKLARIVTGRSRILAFSGAYHGHTLGAMEVTEAALQGTPAREPMVDRLPFNDERALDSCFRSLDKGEEPAAVILETVQGEGGIRIARPSWLQSLARHCRERGVLLIVDDIQVGNGRTGSFFSFEEAGIVPDIVTLSKSLGGGLPLSVVLIKPEHDAWEPGQHTGTFRGNNLAFVAATRLIREYWRDDSFSRSIDHKAEAIRESLQRLVPPDSAMSIRGKGMIWGIEFPGRQGAEAARRLAFEQGLLLETCGAGQKVLKLMPPLTIDRERLGEGLEILHRSIPASVAL